MQEPHLQLFACPACVGANAHALARYAALCQEQNLVPIVEPEVLMDGSHSIERCEEVTGMGLHVVFRALFEQDVSLERMLLKPNMVIAGKEHPDHAPIHEVASATLRCSLRYLPAAVPGIVFLSGGQEDRVATAHLNAINRLPLPRPWKISFSYGRALQDPALEAWHGRDENLEAGNEACTNGHDATARPVSGGIRKRWRRRRWAPEIHPSAVSGAATDHFRAGRDARECVRDQTRGNVVEPQRPAHGHDGHPSDG
jgi:fructose-bisphosphate aldolase class 1